MKYRRFSIADTTYEKCHELDHVFPVFGMFLGEFGAERWAAILNATVGITNVEGGVLRAEVGFRPDGESEWTWGYHDGQEAVTVFMLLQEALHTAKQVMKIFKQEKAVLALLDYLMAHPGGSYEERNRKNKQNEQA